MQTDIMKPSEVATALRMPTQTVLYHLRKGTIPGKKIGTRWLVLRSEVQKILDGAKS